MMPRIAIIAAIDEKNGLGKNNDLLFKIHDDLQRFRLLTNGHPIIMGRKTYESIGRLLFNRTNIIVTRDTAYAVEGAFITYSLEEAITLAKEKPGSEEIFIIGGGQIFKEAIEKNMVDRLYLTLVQGEYNADVFFPDYAAYTKVMNRQEHESEGYKYTFLDLEKEN